MESKQLIGDSESKASGEQAVDRNLRLPLGTASNREHTIDLNLATAKPPVS